MVLLLFETATRELAAAGHFFFAAGSERAARLLNRDQL
jgi:hypothetical protein